MILNNVKSMIQSDASGGPATNLTNVFVRALALVGLSTILGLAFNSSNPLGIRLSEKKEMHTLNQAAAPTLEGGTKLEAPKASPKEIAPTLPEVTTQPRTPVQPSPDLKPALTTVSPSSPASSSASSLGSTPAKNSNVQPLTTSTGAATAAITPNPGQPASVTSGPAPTTWGQVKPLLQAGKLVLVDARAKGMFDAGHIPGAVSLPESSTPEALSEFKNKYSQDSHIVVYCSSTSCSLSFKLAYKLSKDYGFTRTEYMTGGYMEYQREVGLLPPLQANIPTNVNQPPSSTTTITVNPPTSPPPPLPVAASSVKAEPNNAVTLRPTLPANVNPQPTSWTKVGELATDSKSIVIDSRSPEEFIQGHFPGALSLPANSGDARIDAFIKSQKTDSTLIVYGQHSGHTPTFQFARKLLQVKGGKGVRFVVEGFTDYKTTPGSPTGAAPR